MRDTTRIAAVISISAFLGFGSALGADGTAAGTTRRDAEPATSEYRDALKMETPSVNRSAEAHRKAGSALPLSARDELGGRTPATPGIGWLVFFEVPFHP